MNYFILILIFLISACSERLKPGYSYEVNMYTEGVSTASQSITPYLVYGDDLLEFLLKINRYTKTNKQTKEQQDIITYDTIGCRLILANKRTFVLIDSFKRDFAIKDKGPVDSMKGGLTLGNYANTDEYPIFTLLRDTIMKGVQYKICDTTFLQADDSIKMRIKTTFFFLKQHFNTLFKVQGMRHIDPDVSFAGMLVEGGEGVQRQSFFTIVENIRPLSGTQTVLLRDIFTRARKALAAQ